MRISFRSIYRHGFARVAACTVRASLADPAANVEAILHAARRCHDAGAAVAVFPELALSAYAIDDLRLQDALLDAVEQAAARLIAASASLMPLLLVGA
ncbi:MAG: NAD(+) synthase, partial [Acetobacteraceae bacterium]